MSLDRKIHLKYLFLAVIVPVVLVFTIIMSCKVYAQESEPVRSDVRVNTFNLSKSAFAIAVDPSTKKVYVANRGSNTVSVINPITYKVVQNIAVGDSPQGIAVDPNTNKVYVSNEGSNTVSVIDSTTDKVIARTRFSISPSADSGRIKCGTKDVPTNQDQELESYTQCTALPNSGFKFSSWTENLGHNSTKTISTSTLSNSPIDALTSALGLPPTDNGAILNVSDFGNLTANFKQVPPPIPPEYVATLFGTIVTAFIGTWLTPTIIAWRKSRKQRGKVQRHYVVIKSLYDDGKVDEKDIPRLDRLRDDIMDDYANGNISEQHYNNLNSKVSVLYEEIYKKKIDLFDGKYTNGALLDKIKDDINDSYAKGKISEHHYKLLNEKLSDNKSNQQSNNHQAAPPSKNSILTSTTQGSPIKS